MRSDNVTKGVERAPNRSLFYALGYTKEAVSYTHLTLPTICSV